MRATTILAGLMLGAMVGTSGLATPRPGDTGFVYVGRFAVADGLYDVQLSGQSAAAASSDSYHAAAGPVDLSNTFRGTQAGFSTTTGVHNTFLGNQAGYSNTKGHANTFLGNETGYQSATGERNTFLGSEAGRFSTTASYNTFSGYRAGYSNTLGHDNTFSGCQAGHASTTGSYNTFSGYQAGYSNTTGGWNTCVGVEAGYKNTTGPRTPSWDTVPAGQTPRDLAMFLSVTVQGPPRQAPANSTLPIVVSPAR
jgi:hypothetical protein